MENRSRPETDGHAFFVLKALNIRFGRGVDKIGFGFNECLNALRSRGKVPECDTLPARRTRPMRAKAFKDDS